MRFTSALRRRGDPVSIDRRGFLQRSLGAAAGLAFVGGLSRAARPAAKVAPHQALRVVDITRTTVKVPFRETPDRNMARELPHWAISEIVEVKLQSGHVGFGETLPYYTWGAPTDESFRRADGRNAAELMWDDELGAGLQMALFDAVARANDVPIHALLGTKQSARTPLAWWNIDTSPADMAAECREAHRQGYRSYKTKGRPWFDVCAQVEAVSQVVPESFRLAIDFNDTLLDADRGIPILKDLAADPRVAIFETPIFQTDIRGNQRIRKATRVPVAMHYGRPEARVALKEEICDGFVVGGGASRLMRRGAVAAMAEKPFWLQLVGTGITAAWSLQFGGVLTHATWPAVNCHQLYTHSLLTEPIRVRDGKADVPDRPGLGFTLDKEVIARIRIPRPKRRPDPPRLIETTWPDGRRMYFGNTGDVNFVLNPARAGRVPYFERGVKTRLLPNDGTPRWKELYQRARKGPLLLKG